MPKAKEKAINKEITEIKPYYPNKLGDTKVSPERFKQVADDYLEYCKANKQIPLLAKFEFELDISDDTLIKYRKNPAFARSIKKVEKAQEIALLEHGINENKPVFPIFLLKAKHGFQEAATKLDITAHNSGVVQLPPRETPLN
jgi:hypothetical protein